MFPSPKQTAKSATQKIKSSVRWSSLSMIYLSRSKCTFFNKSSVSTWEQIALLLTDLFLYSYKAEILQKIIKEKIIITEVKVLNIIFRFIGDFLSINNPYFANWILKRTIDDINSFSCTQMTRYSIANYALIQC
jgi:hypothetical protein